MIHINYWQEDLMVGGNFKRRFYNNLSMFFLMFFSVTKYNLHQFFSVTKYNFYVHHK